MLHIPGSSFFAESPAVNLSEGLSTPRQPRRTPQEIYRNNAYVLRRQRAERAVSRRHQVMAQVRPNGVHVPLEQRVNVPIARLLAERDGVAGATQLVTILVDRPPNAPLTFRNVRAVQTEAGWSVFLPNNRWAVLTNAATGSVAGAHRLARRLFY